MTLDNLLFEVPTMFTALLNLNKFPEKLPSNLMVSPELTFEDTNSPFLGLKY